MREAIAKAALGDDVYGEDPTVNTLEEKTATLLGKEAGLFVASGTMGNLTGILSQATRGDEVITGVDSHAFRAEGGGYAVLGGVVAKMLPTDYLGRMKLEDVEGAVNPIDPHYARSRLIALENSYGAKAGAPIDVNYFANVRSIARRNGLSIHLDGARLFNAAASLEVDPKKITQYVDTVTICLSKGLCAPVGSVLCGTFDTINEARRIRKVLGGGMRQAGILAAAGIVALDTMIGRLEQDHFNASTLAQGIAEITSLEIDLTTVKTNMVFFNIAEGYPRSASDIASELSSSFNVLIGPRGAKSFRAVTHYWVGESEVTMLLNSLQEVLN
jgi:threonine aldolase